jgi:hypothetical protein
MRKRLVGDMLFCVGGLATGLAQQPRRPPSASFAPEGTPIASASPAAAQRIETLAKVAKEAAAV